MVNSTKGDPVGTPWHMEDKNQRMKLPSLPISKIPNIKLTMSPANRKVENNKATGGLNSERLPDQDKTRGASLSYILTDRPTMK